jgi:hypothetical protein
VSRYDDQVLDEFNRPVPGVSIYVYDDTGALDTLTADDASPLANPLTSDANGLFYFNAGDGEKLLDFRFAGRTALQAGGPRRAAADQPCRADHRLIRRGDGDHGGRWQAHPPLAVRLPDRRSFHWPVLGFDGGRGHRQHEGRRRHRLHDQAEHRRQRRDEPDRIAAVIDPAKVNIAKGAKVTFDLDAAGANAKGLKIYVIGRKQ